MSFCYMCDRPATSSEHVPPKCLFPEKKDLSGDNDLRKALITVPSCEEHNSSKSHDDEYLLYCLSLSLPSNAVAENQFQTKVTRSIKRRPALINELTEKTSTILVENMATGEWSKTTTLDVDAGRLERCLVHIAHAIYFFHFGERWLGKVNVHPNFLMSLDPSEKDRNDLVRKMDLTSEALFSNVKSHGQNEEVFTYKVIDEGNSKAIRMSFYQGNKVTAVFNTDG